MSKARLEKISPDLDTPTDMPPQAVEKISTDLNVLSADTFALYLKTISRECQRAATSTTII